MKPVEVATVYVVAVDSVVLTMDVAVETGAVDVDVTVTVV